MPRDFQPYATTASASGSTPFAGSAVGFFFYLIFPILIIIPLSSTAQNFFTLHNPGCCGSKSGRDIRFKH